MADTQAFGHVNMEGQYATLTFERRLPHPPEAVWEAITETAQLAEWYMTRARIDGRVGGSIDFWSGPSRLHVTGSILVWDPPHVFEHEWNVEPRPELPKGEQSI
ncbi:MAG: SRPBCC domain-containing protein, partial [Nitrososphaerales archaeon]